MGKALYGATQATHCGSEIQEKREIRCNAGRSLRVPDDLGRAYLCFLHAPVAAIWKLVGNATWGPRADDCRGGGWVKHYTVQRRPPTAGQKFRKNGKYGATQAVRCGVFTDVIGGAYLCCLHAFKGCSQSSPPRGLVVSPFPPSAPDGV